MLSTASRVVIPNRSRTWRDREGTLVAGTGGSPSEAFRSTRASMQPAPSLVGIRRKLYVTGSAVYRRDGSPPAVAVGARQLRLGPLTEPGYAEGANPSSATPTRPCRNTRRPAPAPAWSAHLGASSCA